jgi:hypothetical protein
VGGKIILFVVACYWVYKLGLATRMVFRSQTTAWSDALGVDLSVWLAIGWINAIHTGVWAIIGGLVLLGQLQAVLLLGIFTYGMMISDLIVNVPMYERLARINPSLYPKSFRMAVVRVVIIQGIFVAYAGWLVQG